MGGSGRDAFGVSVKFRQSDLNFYISVKVINQTINWKDALAFNGMDPNMDRETFNKLFGDSFISAFLGGGEFNALVSMRILYKAKLIDIGIIVVEAWGGSKLDGGNVGWLAWDSEAEGKSIRTFDLWRAEEKDLNYKEVNFADNPFNKDSVVFAAFKEFSFGPRVQMRLSVRVSKANETRLLLILDRGSRNPSRRAEAPALRWLLLMDSFSLL